VKGLRSAAAKLNEFGTRVRNIGMGLTAASAVVLTPLVAATKQFASYGDTLDKMSKRTGVAVETLSGLAYAASQTGTDIETLEKGFFGLSRSYFDASRGSGEATEAFKRIGLSMKDLAGLSPEQQFKKVAEGLSKVSDESERGAIAQKLLGRSGRQLLPMFADGAAGLERFRAEAEKLGITLSTEDATAAADLTDALDDLKKTAGSVSMAIGATLAKDATALVQRFAEAAQRVRGLVGEHKELIITLAKAAAAVGVAGAGLTSMGLAVNVAASSIKGLLSVLSLAQAGIALLNPVTLTIIGVTAAAVAAYALWGDEIKAELLPAFRELADVWSSDVLPVLQELAAAVKDLVAELGPLEEFFKQAAMGEIKTFAIVLQGVAKSMQLMADAARLLKENGFNVMWGGGLKQPAKPVDEVLRGMEWEKRKPPKAEKAPGQGWFDEDAAAKEEALAEKLAARIAELKIAQIEDAHVRELALINERYNREAEAANGLLSVLEKLEEARELEISNADAAYLKSLEEEEARKQDALDKTDTSIQDQIDRAKVDLLYAPQLSGDQDRREELEHAKRLKMLELDRAKAIREAAATGADIGKINELFDLRARIEDFDFESMAAEVMKISRGPESTFSGEAAWRLGIGMKSDTAAEATAKATEETAKATKQTAVSVDQALLEARMMRHALQSGLRMGS
jgi:hypothetical protein